MIVCEYLDKNVINYLKKESGNTVLTFFKELQSEFNGNKILFIDDVLDEMDYKRNDKYTLQIAKQILEIFAEHVDFDGFQLSLYAKLHLEYNAAIFKIKYAIDKMINKENNKKIVFFDPTNHYTRILRWLERKYDVTIITNTITKSGNNILSKIIKFIENSDVVFYFLDILFNDREKKPCTILWLGARSVKSNLLKELENDFKIQILETDRIRKLALINYGFIKYESLKLKDNKKFNKKWVYFERRYDYALEKISSVVGVETDLVPVIIGIEKTWLKHLLYALCILEDNRDKLGMLFVEQSVVEDQAVAVDFFNREGLPSIELPHGVIGMGICMDELHPEFKLELGNTTKIAVYGERDMIIKNAIREDKLIPTGCPYYDRIIKIKEEQKSHEFLLLILDWIGPFPSSESYRYIFDQVSSMLQLIQHFENEKLIIKLHPGQRDRDEDYIWKIIDNMALGKRVKVKKKEDTIDLLRRAKIVFNFNSSVGIEAILMKKPLIVLDFFPCRAYNYEKFGGCLVARNYEELIYATQQILLNIDKYLKVNQENIERTRRYFSADIKGESYKNVAVVCRELCKNSKKEIRKANN